MEINYHEISYLKDPKPLTLKADYQQFLLSLTGVTVIDITGVDTNKCRVITTLLHGNEPSGLIAIHRWLTSEHELSKPSTNLRFIICSVEAASLAPMFTHRYLPEGVDINRCFGQAKKQGYYMRAQLIEKAISAVSPELVVDLHNTSGSGPAFGVSTHMDSLGLSLAGLFCDTVILSGITLGALMEQNFNCPVLTIECGGAFDEQAHQVAYQGISSLANKACIINSRHHAPVEIVYSPMRLTLNHGVELSFAQHDEGNQGVTLIENIEQFNFGSIHKGQIFAWLDNQGLANLTLKNDAGENVITEYFYLSGNRLLCAKHFRIFMATTNVQIAKTDCLFYIVDLPNSDPH